MVKLHKKPKEPPKTLYQKMIKRKSPSTNVRRLKAEDEQLLFNSKTKKAKTRAESVIIEAETLMDYCKDLMK